MRHYLLQTKSWRGDYQVMRYTPNGQTYCLTRTKRGKTTMYVMLRLVLVKPGVYREHWVKLDAYEAREALDTCLPFYESTIARFMQTAVS